MTTTRGYDQQNISADTGQVIVETYGVPPPSPGVVETMVALRLRNTVNTPESPYLGGQFLVTVRWTDGRGQQEWNVAIQTIDLSPAAPNYNEQGMDIWWDQSQDLTIQVVPSGPSVGSVDVLLLYSNL